MHDPDLAPGSDAMRRADRLLLVAMVILAALLGCYELFDADIWWHLRAGQWILENHRVARVDPFTFSSADRPWIDLHWGFQVALATAHALGGVPGMILLASIASASALAIAATARRSDWPSWIGALCWLPALVLMSTRFDPRPEVFSLVFLAGFLAILFRLDRRPALAWLLVPIQVLWVNTHGLFILGPIVLGCYWLDRAARASLDAWWSADRPDPGRPSPWRHLLPASAVVLAATLANPYGIRGAMLPLELLPKIADANNPYKTYIDEFASLHSAIRDRMAGAPGPHFHLRVQVFLLLMIPWSFLPPALREAGRESLDRGRASRAWSTAPGVIGPLVLVGLAIVAALGLPLPETPAWLSIASRAVPAELLIAGVVAAGLAAYRSRAMALTMVIGTIAAAAWAFWLRMYLFDEGRGPFGPEGRAMPYAGAGLGLLAVGAILRAGGSPFRMLLAAAFTYLSFQAVRNISLFAMAGGAVVAWNLGEWATSIAPARPHRLAGWVPQAMVILLVAAWSLGVVTDRYYTLVGEDVRFGLRERPSTFAHQAARFAGRPGLPGRALAFHLGQAGVYLYHNGPDRKVFIDGRLEVPSLASFREYVRIQDRLSRDDPRWDTAVGRLGDPLILISHEGWAEAEATLLAHPRWRCVYFDEVASIFVTRRGPSSAPGVPDLDLAEMPPKSRVSPSMVLESNRLRREAEVLDRLASVLRSRGGDPWRARIPILIGAAARVRTLLSGDPTSPVDWRLLGLIEWEMVPDLTRPPPGPDDAWDPATGLPWARATYCLRKALEKAPGDLPTLRALAACFRVRRMADARRSIESLLTRADRSEEVFRLLDESLGADASSSWPHADRIAANLLHLGNAEAARRAWAGAKDSPSSALRSARMAGADLAALDAATAESRCRQALSLDPDLGEAWYLLAVALLETGRLEDALGACRECLRRQITAAQREQILGLETLLARRRSGPGPAGERSRSPFRRLLDERVARQQPGRVAVVHGHLRTRVD